MSALSSQVMEIGKGIYLRQSSGPSSAAPSRVDENSGEDYLKPVVNGKTPQIVLIFSWMGAQLPHLLKYSNAYSQIFPEATQILVRSEASFFFTSKTTRERNLQPVVEALDALGALAPPSSTSKRISSAGIKPIIPYPSPNVLVHIFSNGGSAQITTLSEMLSNRAKSVNSSTAMVLDSCPGNGGVEGTIRAFSSAVRNPVLRSLISLFIRILYLHDWVTRTILSVFSSKPHESVLDRIKARLNTEHLLPWLSKKTPRLYLYSTKDVMIPDAEVELHAAGAKLKGFDIRLEKFEDTSHVAHAKVHPKRYWTAIRKLWEVSVQD